MPQKPFVVAITGTSGAGKSTVCRKIADMMPESVLFELDKYEEVDGVWPHISEWIANNFKPNMANLSQPADDLRQLIAGETMTYPFGQGTVHPTKVIIFDTPIGRSHPEFEELIDFLVLIDLPYEVALARRIQRMLEQAESDEIVVKRLHRFIPFYLEFGRIMYQHFDELARESADATVNGLYEIDILVSEVFKLIQKRRS